MTLYGMARGTVEFLFLALVGPAAGAGGIPDDRSADGPRTRTSKGWHVAPRIVARFRQMTGGAFHDIWSHKTLGLLIVRVPAGHGRWCC
ncbi:MAG TPA: hypothetical protein VF590_22070 [Isosphaeraceae bacterium]|jgi:hypothetical protein